MKKLSPQTFRILSTKTGEDLTESSCKQIRIWILNYLDINSCLIIFYNKITKNYAARKFIPIEAKEYTARQINIINSPKQLGIVISILRHI
jgi:hypothetical protein